MSFGFRPRAFRSTWSIAPLGATAFVLAFLEPRAGGQPPCSPPPQSALDTLRVTATDALLRGTPGPDRLVGGHGEDRLLGGEGDDVLRGGPNRDLLDGGPGNDIIEGGDGDDVLAGGGGRDFLFGERGDDRLDGGGGPDVVDGGPGADYMQGGEGDDLLEGCDGDDIVLGGAGNDDLDGSDGVDLLDGGDGNDNLDGGDENDILRGGADVDSLDGADGNDELDGGAGDDFLSGADGADVLRGGAGHDALAGRDGSDYLDGDQGDDLMNGGDGDDVLHGGAGADTLLGSVGNDRLSGGLANDVIRGGDDDDLLDGDDGDDSMIGGQGTDVVRGGDGNDAITLRAGDVDSTKIEVIDGGTNRDTARVEADSLVLSGFTQADVRRLRSAGSEYFEIVDPLTGGKYLVTRVEKVVFQQVVPYVAGGESVLQVVNGSAAELVGRIEFVSADGRPLPTAVGSDSARAIHPLRLAARGSIELSVRPPSTSAVWLYTDQPSGAFVRTVLPGGDSAVVPAGPLLDMFSVPAVLYRNRGGSSGFAVTNDRLSTALRVWLYTAAGVEVEAAEVDVASRGHVVRFAPDLFPRYDRFDGKMIVQGGPMVGVGLQIHDGRTTPAPALPIAPRRGPGPTWLPHIIDGGGRSTTITLLGIPPDTARNGRVAFFDERGRPLALDIVGLGSVAEVPFTIPPGGSVVVSTAGRGARVEGSARITTEKGVVAASARVTMPNAGSVEMPATGGLRGFTALVRRDSVQGTTTVLAISVGPTPTTVDITLHEPGGQRTRAGEARLTLPANGHVAVALERLFPRAVTGRFRGSLVVAATIGTVVPAVIELGRATAAAIPVIPSP